MSFWQQLTVAAEMGASIFAWSLVIFVVAALVLSIIRPAERMRIRSAVLLLALALVGLLTAAVLTSSGVNPAKSSYKWVSWAARFLLWISFVNITSVFVFEVFLDALRLKPPRIMRPFTRAYVYRRRYWDSYERCRHHRHRRYLCGNHSGHRSLVPGHAGQHDGRDGASARARYWHR